MIALERLLASVPRRVDQPWHKIIREQAGESAYRKITAGLEMAKPDQVAEAPYSAAKKKMFQRRLFD